MADHNVLGKSGEEKAAKYLMKKGYKILERNWQEGRHEIDLIALKDGVIHCVEVKTRTGIMPETGDLISSSKEKNLISALNKYMEQLEDEPECQIDLVLVEKKKDDFNVRLIEHAISQA